MQPGPLAYKIVDVCMYRHIAVYADKISLINSYGNFLQKGLLEIDIDYHLNGKSYNNISVLKEKMVTRSPSFQVEIHLSYLAHFPFLSPFTKVTHLFEITICQRKLFYSFLETVHAIIHLNSRYCFPIVDLRLKKSPLLLFFPTTCYSVYYLDMKSQ